MGPNLDYTGYGPRSIKLILDSKQCEERESWNEERRHIHHFGPSSDDQFVMVVEYDNCAAQDYPHRKATVTKVPLNDMRRYHRYHPVHANSNANQIRRTLDENSNVNTNVNTNSNRRSLDDNSNVNTNVNTNQFRRSLDDNSNVNTNMRRSLDENTNVNINTNNLGGDGDGAAISLNDHEVNIEARRSHESNGSRRYGNHNHVPNPNSKSRRNSRNQLNSLYGHQRRNSQGLRRNVLVENKGQRVEVDDNEANVYVEHAADDIDDLAP
ncbi:hypothetical protein KQX54_002976 [Cotesia glomerata]|uniref:Uncharacterized protein n=1 Tax=Cotesia glomerata TaxID=32391 RepID=A0AAV7IFK7_COTGL|nr:hypothetical protein KQX54_002976 [Cotesia glomerata]